LVGGVSTIDHDSAKAVNNLEDAFFEGFKYNNIKN
jgi:hypothetical protein